MLVTEEGEGEREDGEDKKDGTTSRKVSDGKEGQMNRA